MEVALGRDRAAARELARAKGILWLRPRVEATSDIRAGVLMVTTANVHRKPPLKGGSA
jgi:hypothetical protein